MTIDEQWDKLIEQCGKIYTSDEVEQIKLAYQFAKEKHQGKKRLNGTDYMSHPLGVMEILLDLNVDSTTIVSALIHETINHGGSTEDEIKEKFGSDVAGIVSVISKLNKLELNDDSEYAVNNLRKVLVGMSEDVRVL